MEGVFSRLVTLKARPGWQGPVHPRSVDQGLAWPCLARAWPGTAGALLVSVTVGVEINQREKRLWNGQVRSESIAAEVRATFVD